MRLPSSAVALLAAAACVPPPPRAELRLDEALEVVASNSLVLIERVRPRRDGDALRVDYPLLVQNTGRDLASVGLGHATAYAGTSQVSVTCRVGTGGPRVLVLRPDAQARVDCELSLDAAALARAPSGDLRLVLVVPVRTLAGEELLAFPYRLTRAEAS